MGVGAAGMAMWLAKKYFANKKQSQQQQQQSYPPSGQQGELRELGLSFSESCFLPSFD